MPTILVVDDSQTDRCRASGLLRRVGHETQTASDGREALKLASAQRFDAIVTDMQMPNVDGITLVQEIAQNFPFVPVVVITGKGSESAAVRALQAGAASYVPKADLAKQLPEIIERICAAANSDRHFARLSKCLVRQELSFRIITDLELIPPAVRTVRESIEHAAWIDPSTALRLTLAFEEALLNAVYHGNLEVDSCLREEDATAYYHLAETRSHLPEFRNRTITITIEVTESRILFDVCDEGDGFDPEALPDPTDPEFICRASGRGLLLIQTFMDEVRHNKQGTQITMIKHAPQTPMAPPCDATLEETVPNDPAP